MAIQKESTDLNSDLAWLTHQENRLSESVLVTIFRSTSTTLVLSLLYHLTKNL